MLHYPVIMALTVTFSAPLEDSDIIGEWFLCMRRLRQLAGAVCDGGVGEHCIKVEEGQEDKFRTTQKMFGVRVRSLTLAIPMINFTHAFMSTDQCRR